MFKSFLMLEKQPANYPEEALNNSNLFIFGYPIVDILLDFFGNISVVQALKFQGECAF